MWGAGMAGGGALVAVWGVVGPGYGWLTAAVVLAVGGAAVLAAGSVAGIVSLVLVVGAGLAARNRRISGLLFAGAAIALLGVGLADGGVVATFTGSVLLGAMTSEMMLGHWFLIDPRLPRWALRRLTLIAGGGLAADVIVLAVRGAFAAGDGAWVAAMVVLVAMTGVLVAAVWFALREPGYAGVMAATGLSYLGVLTTFGVVVVGRLLVAGL